MSMEQSRREFLRTAGLTGLGVWVTGNSWAQGNSPNEQINIACIGVDGKGRRDTHDAANSGNIVALCDVDDEKLNKAGELYPRARKFNDYREMLDQMDKSIDAVTVTIPDHSHAAAAAMALHMGKHTWCQKPLTHSIWEARRLAELARHAGVVTQMGNQGTSSDNLRKSAAAVQAGAIGTVKEVHVWTDRPVWPQGISRPAPARVPSSLHWDLWLGPAPARPYAVYPDHLESDGKPEGAYHYFNWRGWWDFGCGALGDMACHTVNLPFMALDLRDPISAEAHTSGHNKDSYPTSSAIRFEFAATKKRPAVTLFWYDGGKTPSEELIPEDIRPLSKTGSLMVGDKGKLYSTGDYGRDNHIIDGIDVGEVHFVQSPGQFEEFAAAIKGGPKTVSNFPDYAGPLTETILLGNLAVWADGNKIEWDAKKMHAKTAAGIDLSHIIRPRYRRGYSI